MIGITEEGDLVLDEDAEELKEDISGNYQTYGDLSDGKGSFIAQSIVKGPTSVMRQEEEEIRYGDADIAFASQAVSDYQDDLENLRLDNTEKATIIGTVAGAGYSAFEGITSGDPIWFVNSLLFLNLGKDTYRRAIEKTKKYNELKEEIEGTIEEIESEIDNLDSFELIYDESIKPVGNINIGGEVDNFADDLDTGQGFQ